MIAGHRPDLSGASHRRWLAPLCGFVLLAMMFWLPVRQTLESSMTLHMLAQYPLVMASGALLIGPVPARWQGGLQRSNELGMAGLLFVAVTMAVLMVPRVLDLVLVSLGVEALKFLALTLSGAALRLSWQRAGTVVQAFFMGNVLPMLAVVGTLYQDANTRLCNAYLLADQQTLGAALPWIAVGILALWMLSLAVLARYKPAAIGTSGKPSPP